MDWQAITALCAAISIIGTISGWLGRGVYYSGWKDKASTAADLQAAASIVRLEFSLKDLAETVHIHERDDAAKFARLETLVTVTTEGLKTAAQEMRGLTERIDRFFLPYRGERHGD